MRGRRIECPDGSRVRPVMGRLRESLFSSLGDLEGLTVLDLFSGVGSLGIESISRGAIHSTFVEKERVALDCLRENIRNLDVEKKARIFPGSVYDFLDQLEQERAPFDLLFADPPYDGDDIAKLTKRLTELMEIASVVVVKHFVRDDPDQYGQTPEPVRVLRRGDDRIKIWRGGE